MAEQSGRKVVVLSKATTEQYSNIKNCMPTTFSSTIPIVDLSKPDAKTLIVKACEEFGFFKVINHGVPMETISQLEYSSCDKAHNIAFLARELRRNLDL